MLLTAYTFMSLQLYWNYPGRLEIITCNSDFQENFCFDSYSDSDSLLYKTGHQPTEQILHNINT